jgi:hypothetical protein
MDTGEKAKEFVNFQIRRKITNLYKQFLFILEDLRGEGYNIPEDQYQKIRKRILDYGNDASREIEESLKSFDINIKL